MNNETNDSNNYTSILINSFVVPIITPFFAAMFVAGFRDPWGFGQGILFLLISALSLVVGILLSLTYIIKSKKKILGVFPLVLNIWPFFYKQSYADLIQPILNLFI